MEQIKQEIINNIYENGENLITGPILQEVLLDMVDDYNGKVSSGSVPGDLVEKTGSWDDAADWVEDNSGSLVHDTDLDGYATEQWVEVQGYLKEVPEGYATTESLNELSESVAELSSSIPSVDLSGYATTESVNEATQSVKDWVEAKHYLTTASLSGSVTEESVQFMINDSTASMKEWVENQNYATETYVSESIANLDIPDTSGFVTTQSYNQDSASFDERINSISGSDLSGYATTESLNLLSESVAEDLEGKADRSDLPDLTGYATEQWVQEQGYLTEHQDISGLATTESLNQVSSSLSESIAAISASGGVDLSGYATTSSVSALSESVRSLGNQVNGFGEDLDTLNGTVAGLASTSSLNSLSESVATDIDSLEESIGNLEQDIEDRVDWDTYDTKRAEFSQSVASDITSLSESIAAISGSDLSGYVTTASYNADSASFDQRINAIVIPDLSEYATTASLNNVSQSLSASIAAISGSDLSVLANTSDPNNPVFQALATASFAKWGNEKWEIDIPLEGIVEGNVDNYLNLNNVLSPLQMYLLQAGLWKVNFDYYEGEDKTYWRIDTMECPADIYWGDNQIGKFLQSLGLVDWDDSQWYSKEPDYFTEASASFDQRINNITGSGVDLSGYATTSSVNSISESLSQSIAAITGSDLSGYATTESVNNLSSSINTTFKLYATTQSVTQLSQSISQSISQITGSAPDLSGYATTESVNLLSASFDQRIDAISGSDLSGYATTASVNDLSSSVSDDFENVNARISSIIASSGSLWEPGTGVGAIKMPVSGGNYNTASGELSLAIGRSCKAIGDRSFAQGLLCQAIGNNSHAQGSTTTASGTHAHAEGWQTSAEGFGSHTEGYKTKVTASSSDPQVDNIWSGHAEGEFTLVNSRGGHTEGYYTTASGAHSHAEGSGSVTRARYSHAEGNHTETSNPYEHAQGQYNATASNQIFSVGVGNSVVGRKNALSIQATVKGSGSVYIQGIGGYDGTNPQEGVNDLASAINQISSSGYTTETWTFILEDSSSVTKNIVVA